MRVQTASHVALATAFLLGAFVLLAPARAAADSLAHAAHEPVGDVGTVAAALALAALGAAAARARRRLAGPWLLSLALLVALFGLETAVHSVHHLGDSRAAESCAVFAASQNISIEGGDAPQIGEPAWQVEGDLVPERSAPPRLLAFRPDVGRAPPPAASA